VERKCKKVASSLDGKRAIYVDSINSDEILSYIRSDDRHKKKFKFISDIILGGHKITELYDKEDINDKCKNVTVMKFFKGQENDRIYCKEIKTNSGVHIVVASILHLKKKSNSLSSKEKNIIEIVANYEYEV
jgi:hypothetical protein